MPFFEDNLALDYIHSNLTCLRTKAEQGSADMFSCYYALLDMLRVLPEKMMRQLAQEYFTSPDTGSRSEEAMWMVDVFASANTELSNRILIEVILRTPVNEELLKRWLLHIGASTGSPAKELTERLLSLVRDEESGVMTGLSKGTRNKIVLSLGALAYQHHTDGDTGTTQAVLDWLHGKLGLHDPWRYRSKRALMSDKEKTAHDLEKVVLLEALGNGCHESSFEFIVSHVNSSISPWVKRSGIHALRHYHTEEAVLEIERAAYTDENEEVRYEARLQYEAHPLANTRTSDDPESSILMAPANSSFVEAHSRQRRSLKDKELHFRLQAPSVDWRKRLGGSSIGASFGVIMINYLDLKMSPLHGWVKIEIHDEVYARAHFGFIGMNVDFFSARVCFKGGADYDVNTIWEYDSFRKAREFMQLVKDMQKVIDNMSHGVKLLSDLVSAGHESLKAKVEKLIISFKALPSQVANFGTVVPHTMDRLGNLAVENLPDFLQPVDTVVKHVTDLIDTVKSDVKGFYNSLSQIVETRIPVASKRLFKAVGDILQEIGQLLSDPLSTVKRIGRNVVIIGHSIAELRNVKKNIEDLLSFDEGKRPYWMDLKGVVSNVIAMAEDALRSIRIRAESWINEVTTAEDPIKVLTDLNMTTAVIRQTIVSECKQILNGITQPILAFQSLGAEFTEAYDRIFDLIQDLKKGYRILSDGFKRARSIIQGVHGPRCPVSFPKRIRLPTGHCKGDGFYPSKLENGLAEYRDPGIDVEISSSSPVPAPFSGYVERTDAENEIIIRNVGELPTGSDIIISNVVPSEDIYSANDHLKVDRYVNAGDVIGAAAESPCRSETSHIHFAVRCEGGTVDPTRYLPQREPILPRWDQKCSDYRILYRNIVKDISEIGDIFDVEKSDFLHGDLSEMPEEIDANESPNFPTAPTNPFIRGEDGAVSIINGIGDNLAEGFQTLINRTDAFLEHFSLNRLKLGEIMQYLSDAALEENKQKLNELFDIIKDIITASECKAPGRMTDEQLQFELTKRGKDSSGNREKMLESLKTMGLECPLLAFGVKKLGRLGYLYCDYDEKCLGIRCCVSVNVFDLIQTSFSALVKFDPQLMTLFMKIGPWEYEASFADAYEELSGLVDTGIRVDFLDVELFVRYDIQKAIKGIQITVGLGLLPSTDVLWNIFDVVIPIPTVDANGTLTWPKISWNSYFNSYEVKKGFEDAGRILEERAKERLIDAFLDELGINKYLLANTASCPIPEKMTSSQLAKELSDRGISARSASRDEQNELIRQMDRTCTTVSNRTVEFPEISLEQLRRNVYLSVASDCMRVDVCVDISVPGLEIAKSFSAFIMLDPCRYVMHVGFENFTDKYILLDYNWGAEESLKLTNDVYITYRLGRDVEEGVFTVTAAIRFASFVETTFLDNFEIPIPLCNGNIQLPGNGDLLSLASAIGGTISEEIFTSFLQSLGLDRLLDNTECSVTDLSTDCPLEINDFIPAELREIATCVLLDGCLGVRCCFEFGFEIPFSTRQQNVSIPFVFKFDPCYLELQIDILDRVYTERLVEYNWGTSHLVHLGSVDDVVSARFSLDIHEDGALSIDVEVGICLPVGNDVSCIPKEGLHILENRIFHPCNISRWFSDALQDGFSISEWLLESETSLANISLGQAGLDYVLGRLNLSKVLRNTCDRGHPPYSPTVNGWNVGCPEFVVNLPDLPSFVSCHIEEDCSTIRCCVDIPLLGISVEFTMQLDLCTNMIVTWVDEARETFENVLSEYKWGTWKTIRVAKVLFLEFKVKKVDQLKYFVDLKVAACFDPNRDCFVNVTLLEQTELPQRICQGVDKGCFDRAADLAHHCIMDEDCQGLNCDAVLTDSVSTEQINTSAALIKFRLNKCKDEVVLGLDEMKWTITLSSVTRGHTNTFGTLKRMVFRIEEAGTHFSADLNVTACSSTGSNCPDTVIFQNLYIRKASCAEPNVRRRRQAQITTDLPSEIKALLLREADDAEIDDVIERFRSEAINLKKRFMQKIDLGVKDMRSSFKSVVKSLGARNPFSLPYVQYEEATPSSSVTGAEEIIRHFKEQGSVVSNKMVEFGVGLTNKGLDALGKMLADITIGDLDALLELSRLDAETLHDLIENLMEVIHTVVASKVEEFIDENLENAFSSVDKVVSGKITFPRQSIEFFSVVTPAIWLGPVPLNFYFQSHVVYGMDISVGVKVLEMVGSAAITPFGALSVRGGASVGVILYAQLELVGDIMNIQFPTAAELTFGKFPLDVTVKMDLVIIPLRLELRALLTLRIKLLFFSFRIVLFKASLWKYQSPSISKRIFTLSKKENDDSPPVFEPTIDLEDDSASLTDCDIKQIPGEDITMPGFEISVAATDSLSRVRYFLNIGTVPGGRDIVEERELGGATTKIYEMLSVTGVPLYFTVFAQNSAGARSSVTCSIPSYDVTVPSGRFTADFLTTSNPSVLKASVVTHDETRLIHVAMAVGYGHGIFGDQVSEWRNVSLSERISTIDTGVDPFNLRTLEHFTGMKNGRLIGGVSRSETKVSTAGNCARLCLNLPEHSCLSINYDFGKSGTCELLKAIEGDEFLIADDGLFGHYERLGIGHAVEFEVTNLPLEHGQLLVFNLAMENALGYRNIISTKGTLVDFTTPEPAHIVPKRDYLERIPCSSVIPEDRPEWMVYCLGEDQRILNHRVIEDGHGSSTVFNGAEAKTDLLFTRANNYVSANWDGFHDNETGIRGYTMAVGRRPCEDLVHPHHDPLRHFLHKSQWDNKGQIYPIPPPFSILEDGAYYVSVRAVNQVEFGGPLSLTVCHSTPLVVDTSPPEFNEIYAIRYDEQSNFIYASFNFSDLHSGMLDYDFCLGESTHDCKMLPWNRIGTMVNVAYRFHIVDGVPAWVKIRGRNNVDLRTVGVANQAIVVDSTGPEKGTVYDGPRHGIDALFMKEQDLICANWFDFYDPESGIAEYLIGVGRQPGATDVVALTRISGSSNEACLKVSEDQPLQHMHTYYVTVTAINGAIVKRNATSISNGVYVDLTPPEGGSVIDGLQNDFCDIRYSASKSSVGLQWDGYNDPESGIERYTVRILSVLEGRSEVLQDWADLGGTSTNALWKHFHLRHQSQVYSEVKVTNGAENEILSTTDGFTVDHTPPLLNYLGDGSRPGEDIAFQVNDTAIAANFNFEDPESGLDILRFQIYERRNGQRNQVYPATYGEWYEKVASEIGTFVQSDLYLNEGTLYTVRIGAVNNAGILGIYETNGVMVDNTKPEVVWLRVGELSGIGEDTHEGFVYQSDHKGIKVSWFARDEESGVEIVRISIGHAAGDTDIYDWHSYNNQESNVYIDNLELQDTDLGTMSPIYYVSMRVLNGAGEESDIISSTPLAVVPEDVVGQVIDGPVFEDGDLDYQSDTSTLSISFDGFESFLHGIASFEWAIGSFPGGEDIQPFIELGINHQETLNPLTNGTVSYGVAQTTIELSTEEIYYSTLRGITNKGVVLQSQTDGVLVDITAPNISVKSFMNLETEEDPHPNPTYLSKSESLTVSWEVEDSNTLVEDVPNNILCSWYGVGIYPGDDQFALGMTNLSTSNHGKLSTKININGNGSPTFITINAANKAGILTKLLLPPVIIDETPPVPGNINCGSFAKPNGHVECSWNGFFDDESPLAYHLISVDGNTENAFTLQNERLPASMKQYVIKGVTGQHGEEHVVTLKAINSVGLESFAFSNAISIDTTPPVTGLVVELSMKASLTGNQDIATFKGCSGDDCLEFDAICQESFTTVSAAWQPFEDPESGILRYEIAIGTTPDGVQVKDFSPVTPDPVTHTFDMTGLNLYGLTQIFVRIKAINRAGISSVTSSNGVYLSYLSQNRNPPSPVGIWDGHPDFVGDVDFQKDNYAIYAGWDVSGDPCPVSSIEWAIERTDGFTLQPFKEINDLHGGTNDELSLQEGDTVYSLLRVRNAMGFQYTLRSNGVTVRNNPLAAGTVFDGDVAGYDLNFLPSRAIASCNWDGFGAVSIFETSEVLTGNPGVKSHIEPSTVISYYEVALGTDRRFQATRDNVVPFTNVGTNKTVTFTGLDLTPWTATYYCTVRAFSLSQSRAERTSNGFAVVFNGGVLAGTIKTERYIVSTSTVHVQWDGFYSKVDLMLFYVAVSSNGHASNTSCKQYVDGGHASEDLKMEMFDVYPVTNVGMSTYSSIDGLRLIHGHTYFVWVMGLDKAGECNMTAAPVTVDTTPPTSGEITTGPYYGMLVTYSPKRSSISVKWRNFADDVSGIKKYTLSLLSAKSCNKESVFQPIGLSVELGPVYEEYTMTGMDLQTSSPYKIRFDAENGAGLQTTVYSSPVLFDDSLPLPGDVKEGRSFKQDVVWWGNTSTVVGTLLHVQTDAATTCTVHHINLATDKQWSKVNLQALRDTRGDSRNVRYGAEFVKLANEGEELVIKFSRDTKYNQYLTGAYSRPANMENEGTYRFEIKSSEGNTFTEVMLLDAPVADIQGFAVNEEADFSQEGLCICCDNENITAECRAQCACSIHGGSTGDDNEGEYSIPSKQACGLQIISGLNAYVLLWCRSFNSTEIQQTRTPLQFDPSQEFHEYQMAFVREKEDLTETLIIEVSIDGQPVSKLYDIPALSTSCNFIMHVQNLDTHVPEFTNVFNVSSTWTMYAYFRRIVFPPPLGELCRYGVPFRAGGNSILRYEAGIGSAPGDTDVAAFREVLFPCIPCTDACSAYSCSESCDGNQIQEHVFTISDLDLQPTILQADTNATGPSTYYITVKAVMQSGISVTSSSNGFYVDTTPPVFYEDVMIYIDVDQGDFTPVSSQGSNSTIKSVWQCLDDNSKIESYQWAIGTMPGETDVQNFTNTGITAVGVNDGLLGVLEHNITYFVSIECTNEAGLTTLYHDTKGVCVLLDPPDASAVQTDIVGVVDLPSNTKPSGIKEMDDPKTIGTSFEVIDDPTVIRYDLCIGSSELSFDDILPCTWVGYNTSGTVMIRDGRIYFEDTEIYDLKNLNPLTIESNETGDAFYMEPGRNLFLWMRLCNEAIKCSYKQAGIVVVTSEHSYLETSDGIQPFSLSVSDSVSRKRRSGMNDITVATLVGVPEGITLLVNLLDDNDLSTTYASDASMNFVSYITSPNASISQVSRALAGRLQSIGTSFTIGTLGQLSLGTELIVTFPQLDVNLSDDDSIINILVHWDPDLQQWSLSSDTCKTTEATVTHNMTELSTFIMVCNTRSSQDKEDFFFMETQFAIALGKAGFVNLPPFLQDQGPFAMQEDEGTLILQLTGTDPENDELTYLLTSSAQSSLGAATLSSDGLLRYTPCRHCYGSVSMNIELRENITVDDIQPNTVTAVLRIDIEPVNDAPTVFLLDSDGQGLLQEDRTEPVKIFLENRAGSDIVYSAVFGAFDVDASETLRLLQQISSNGSLQIESVDAANYTDYFTCNSTTCLGSVPEVDPSRMSWLLATVRYQQNTSFTGVDTVQLVAQDAAGSYSDVVTVSFVVMEMPCQNNGICIPKSSLISCNDEIRISNFDLNFECGCPRQWTGTYCDADVDECTSSPCSTLYSCTNTMGGYQCDLIIYYPILIALGGLLVVGSVFAFMYKRKRITNRRAKLKIERIGSILLKRKHFVESDNEHVSIPEMFPSEMSNTNELPRSLQVATSQVLDCTPSDEESDRKRGESTNLNITESLSTQDMEVHSAPEGQDGRFLSPIHLSDTRPPSQTWSRSFFEAIQHQVSALQTGGLAIMRIINNAKDPIDISVPETEV